MVDIEVEVGCVVEGEQKTVGFWSLGGVVLGPCMRNRSQHEALYVLAQT